MRHLGSLILSLALTPVIWLLTGIGLVESHRSRVAFGPELRIELLLGLAALVAAGALVTVLVMPRLSPVGPAVAGLAFLGMTAWAVVDPASMFRTLPESFLGADDAATTPALGYAALLAVPLLATVLSPRRWRRHDRPAPQPQLPQPAGYPQSPGVGQPVGHGPVGILTDTSGRPAAWTPVPAPTAEPLPQRRPAEPPAHQPAPPAVEQPDEQITVRLSVPAATALRPAEPQADAEPTTRLTLAAAPDETEVTAKLTLPSPQPATTETTIRIVPPPAPRPTAEDAAGATDTADETTASLSDAPPPPEAYPLPGHAAPTATPVDPDATRKL